MNQENKVFVCCKHNYSNNYVNAPFHFGCEDETLKDFSARNTTKKKMCRTQEASISPPTPSQSEADEGSSPRVSSSNVVKYSHFRGVFF